MGKYDFLAILAVMVLLAVIALGITTNAVVGKVSSILESPAITTNITVEHLTIVTPDGVEITLNGFEARGSSKFIDLVIIAAATQ